MISLHIRRMRTEQRNGNSNVRYVFETIPSGHFRRRITVEISTFDVECRYFNGFYSASKKHRKSVENIDHRSRAAQVEVDFDLTSGE